MGCALAPNAAILIASRVAQGVGAVVLVPCSLALLNSVFGNDKAHRANAVGWWTAAGSVSLAAGSSDSVVARRSHVRFRN